MWFSFPLSAFTAIGVSSNCCSETYGGPRVLSEPEAQAVTDFLARRKDDFLCFFTIHSYGQLLLVPYGHPNFTAPNYDELVFAAPHTAQAKNEDERTTFSLTAPTIEQKTVWEHLCIPIIYSLNHHNTLIKGQTEYYHIKLQLMKQAANIFKYRCLY